MFFHIKYYFSFCVVSIIVSFSNFLLVHVAKTEWKKLRDNHRDALKRAKLGKNKLLPAQITTWKYAKAMQFLEPHMKYRITENIEMDPPPATSSKNSEHDVSTTKKSDTPPYKRKLIDQSTTYESPKIRHDLDALECFFNCIFQSTREMPQWMQTQVKKKIFAVVIEAEELLSSQEEISKEHNVNNRLSIETKIKCEVFTDDSCDNVY